MKKMETNKISIKGAILHPGQLNIVKEVMKSKAMYFTICTPRQFGKSFLAIQLMLYYAINKPNSKLMFTTPVYSQASKVFKELLEGIKHMDIVEKFNAAENSVIFKNKSELFFKSVQVPDNLRGYAIDYMFLDEAAMYKDAIFNTVLRPMLTVKGKKCFLFSTPKGKNFFYEFYQKGIHDNPRYMSFRGSSDLNPFANREEIEDARSVLPPAIFRQEYLAEFVDDGGDVFNNFNHIATLNAWQQPKAGEVYYAGIDLGRQDDFTVLTILDSKGNNVFTYRRNKAEWTTIVDDLARHLHKYKPRYTLVEVNGIGDVVFSLLKTKYGKIAEFVTSINSKQTIIEELILAFESKTIALPTKILMPSLSDELSDFSFGYSKQNRKITYAARSGHDDTVMSLAIAHHAKLTGIHKGQYKIY